MTDGQFKLSTSICSGNKFDVCECEIFVKIFLFLSLRYHFLSHFLAHVVFSVYYSSPFLINILILISLNYVNLS